MCSGNDSNLGHSLIQIEDKEVALAGALSAWGIPLYKDVEDMKKTCHSLAFPFFPFFHLAELQCF